MRNFRVKLNGTVTKALYSDEVTKNFTLYSGQMFYREEVEGKFSFFYDDFDLIDVLGFADEIAFVIELDTGGGYATYWEGYFFKRDCEIHYNENMKMYVVTPKADDRYRSILEGEEKEFNLIELSPARYKLKYVKQGVLQVWTYPSNYMTNITRGNHWVRRVDITETDSVKLREEYKFGFQVPTGTALFVPGDATVLDPDVGGFYTYDTYERISDSFYGFKGVGSGTIPPGGSSFFDPIGTDDPRGYCDLKVEMDASDFDDYDDFDSLWSFKGITCSFLGVEYDDIEEKYYAYFRGATAGFPFSGAAGTITHISGAVNTSTKNYVDWIFRRYLPGSAPDPDDPYSFILSDGLSVLQDEKRKYYVVRWCIAENITPSTFDYVYLAPTGQELSTFPDMDQEGPLFRTLTGTTGLEKCRLIFNIFYQRVLTDLEEVEGVATEKINDASDVQREELGYRYAIPKEYPDFVVTDINTATKTRYGKFNESAANYAGLYFDEFTTGNLTVPINRPDWKEASVWFDVGPGKAAERLAADLVRELRHTYRLSEVINLLLDEVDNTITFEETTAYSDFLFNATNPVSGEAFPKLFIAPKSNVINGEYTTAATRAPITLKQIFDMLRDAFRCYWFIDDSNRLRIEHLSWFERGGSYSTDQISFNLTTQRAYKNNALWSTDQNIVKYDAIQLPEIVRTKWMDDQSPAFDGLDLIATDNYVDKGVVEEVRVVNFSTDIDYMILEGESVNPDGFALLGAFQNNISGEWTIPFKEVTILGNWKYDLQNGYLSFMYLQSKFFRHGASSENLLINDQVNTALSVKRGKSQTVNIPNPGAFDPLELMTTEQGNGKIEVAKINIISDYLEVELKHEIV